MIGTKTSDNISNKNADDSSDIQIDDIIKKLLAARS